MTKQAKREYIDEIRQRYLAAPKHEQTAMLTEIVTITRWNRKYVIRVLNKQCEPTYPKAIHAHRVKKKVGRPMEYNTPPIVKFLCSLWHDTNQACGKRLKSILPLWLPWYKAPAGFELSLKDHVLLTRISAATIDRLLRPERSRYRVGNGRATTKPGTLTLKNRIPIKTDQWKEHRPGFLEVDTVAHCGTATAGQFVFSLNTVDLGSGWVEARAVWGKGERGVLEAFTSIEHALPFPLRGFDSDSGSEFINHHMKKYLQGRRRSVEQTRSRTYQKNDNAHIEQKNWTHIRQLLGYERFDNPQVVDMMNDLYAHEYALLANFFIPSVKLQNKERIGSKIIKRHDQPQTPCQRLVRSRSIPEETKKLLRHLQQSLNPFDLRHIIRTKVKRILQHRTTYSATLTTEHDDHVTQCSVPSHRGPKTYSPHEVTPLALRARSVTSSLSRTTYRKKLPHG